MSIETAEMGEISINVIKDLADSLSRVGRFGFMTCRSSPDGAYDVNVRFSSLIDANKFHQDLYDIINRHGVSLSESKPKEDIK